LTIDPQYRRAALIATAVTLPLIIIAAFVITSVQGNTGKAGTSSGPLPPLSLPAPPHAAELAAACTKVLIQIEALPITLDGQAPRVVDTTASSYSILAWGDPAIIYRCGVDRPKDLAPNSAALFVDAGIVAGPYYDVVKDGDANVWTTVDLEPYISITVPAQYNSAPVAVLTRAIHKALPTGVCNPGPTGGNLCDRRK
jgi:hypothetical protein